MPTPPIDSRAHRAPDGCAIYAIGDVHGRLDLLLRATDLIRDGAGAFAGKTIGVFLGDYIDRGPQSAAVIAHLRELAADAAFESVFLRGNHEQSLLDAIDGKPEGQRWLDYGGRETLASYGARVPGGANPSIRRLRAAAARAVPAEDLAFIRATQTYHKLGDYIFVHAGLRPDRLLEEQSESDMLWLRHIGDEPPLWREKVVHGHSPTPRPVEGRWHIGIDTGAHETGALTVLRLEGEDRRFLKIEHGPHGAPTVRAWEGLDRRPVNAPSGLPRAVANSRVPAGWIWNR